MTYTGVPSSPSEPRQRTPSAGIPGGLKTASRHSRAVTLTGGLVAGMENNRGLWCNGTRPINMTQLARAASHIGIAIAIPRIFSLLHLQTHNSGPILIASQPGGR